MTTDVKSIVERFLHYRLRDALDWRQWFARRSWNKELLLKHIKCCDFGNIVDIRIRDGDEQVAIPNASGKLIWFPIESQGSGFCALYKGIFQNVLKNT